MTRRLRRFVFLIFVVFFAVVSIGVIFFAQGYRFDFDSLKIVKTGGIFIKTSVDDAKIYINDEYIKSTSGILNHSILISGLAPKNYNVFVYKENYYPWNKTVEIKNGIVAELNNIILFPLELNKIKITELPIQTISEFTVSGNKLEIKNNKNKTAQTYNLDNGELASSGKFSVATSSTEIISSDKNKILYARGNQLWIEYRDGTDKEQELLASYGSPVQFFDWFKNSAHLIWLADNELSIAELDNRGDKRNSIKFYLNIKPPVFWDRDNSDFYFFEETPKKNILYKINFNS